ncbi:GNAT family N-acetyltransferase [Haladaptatus caseinilyticus]|uniref:GNAT family N-acetyltransferase n=1 Tax=Haladaptatus caseinilyticus TaxID=2993314 RepID=UPI00224B09F1|nr:GNAT family N-acetyltransferase [Haladaptatus caseinilyticus]
MTESTIRTAEPTDSTAIQRVARESWHAVYDDIIGAGTVDETIDQWYDMEGLREDATRSEHEFYVSERDDIVGFAHAGPGDGDDIFQLIRLYVVPDAWGSGLGGRLLDRVEERLRARTVERVRLSVFADNDVGVGFYESRGFERVEEREATGFDAGEYVYEKVL